MLSEESNNVEDIKLCQCGCGERVTGVYYKNRQKIYSGFKHGHNTRSRVGSNHPNWKGGRYKHEEYWHIKKPNHPFRNKRGYIYEHRWIMEQYLGRYLDPKEVVHHKDGNKENNDILNLQLFDSNGEHMKLEKTKDMSNRFCFICGGNKTYPKLGTPGWYHLDEHLICARCYINERRRRKRIDGL